MTQNDASFFTATYAWDLPADDALRRWELVNPMQEDPRAALNQTAIIDTYRYEGVNAWDFSNPYALAATQILETPTLIPDYGLRGSTPEDVQHNILTRHILIPGV